MARLSEVKKLAKKLGATVEDDKIGNTHECTVTAPDGYIWKDGVHQFVDCAYIPWKPDYADLMDRMNFGLERCEDPECEWCHHEEEADGPTKGNEVAG